MVCISFSRFVCPKNLGRSPHLCHIASLLFVAHQQYCTQTICIDTNLTIDRRICHRKLKLKHCMSLLSSYSHHRPRHNSEHFNFYRVRNAGRMPTYLSAELRSLFIACGHNDYSWWRIWYLCKRGCGHRLTLHQTTVRIIFDTKQKRWWETRHLIYTCLRFRPSQGNSTWTEPYAMDKGFFLSTICKQIAVFQNKFFIGRFSSEMTWPVDNKMRVFVWQCRRLWNARLKQTRGETTNQITS